MLFCSHVVVLLPNAQEELLALKKAQEQPPVNANAELTLRKKLNAAKKRKTVKETQHPKMMRKHLNKMMMEDKAAALTKQKRERTHHPRSRLVAVAIKIKQKNVRKNRKMILTWQPPRKIVCQRNHRKKRNMPQERAATS